MLHRFRLAEDAGDRVRISAPGVDLVFGAALESDLAENETAAAQRVDDVFETEDEFVASRLDFLDVLEHEVVADDTAVDPADDLAEAAAERQAVVEASRTGESTPDGNAVGVLSEGVRDFADVAVADDAEDEDADLAEAERADALRAEAERVEAEAAERLRAEHDENSGGSE